MAAPNTRVVLDLLRDTKTIVDLTPYFQGRVGDSDSFLPMAIIAAGRAYDLTGKSVIFQGKDFNGTEFTVYGKNDVNRHGDDWSKGRFTFYFPADTFEASGEWDWAFFRVVDIPQSELEAGVDPAKTTSIVSTLNVKLNVLNGTPTMAIAKQAYHSGMQSALDDVQQFAADAKKQISNTANSLLNDFPDLLAKMQTVKALDNSLNDMIKEKQLATVEDLGVTLIENNIGGLPTPAMYIEKGFYRIHYGYAYLGDLDIVPGKTVDATDCEQVAMVQTTVLNNIVSQEATVQAKNDYVYKLERKSTGDTTWSKWHAVAQF